MDRYGLRMIPWNEKLEFDQYLLRAFIMNGFSFNAVANSFFTDFIRKLNPSYTPPDRMKFSRHCLMKELVHVEKQNESILIEASWLTLNLDGWTDQNNRSFYEFNLITEIRRAVVLALIDLSPHRHSAEFLLDRLQMVLQRVSTAFAVTSKIAAIVTDNPSVMQKLRNLFIAKPGHRHILAFRCFAHAINLIAGNFLCLFCMRHASTEKNGVDVIGDIVKHPVAFRIISKTTAITNYLNKSHHFKAKLKEEAARIKCAKETLDVIVVTRWTSVSDSLRSFLSLQTPLQTIVSMEKESLPAKVVNIISHRSFFTDIEHLYSIMKALAYAVSLIQSRSATLADCYLILAYLYYVTSSCSKSSDHIEFHRYVSKVAKIRLDEYQNPYYLACFYLHPKYRGAGLLSESRASVYRCIAEYSKLIGNSLSTTKNIISALQRYEIKVGPYSLIYHNSMYFVYYSSSFVFIYLIHLDDTPTTWWCMIKDTTHGNSLQQIALRLLSITPHSVMPERLFSVLDWHHSKRRNRLSPFTLESIAKIHTFYKGNLSDPSVDVSFIEDALGDGLRSEDEHFDASHGDQIAEDFQLMIR